MSLVGTRPPTTNIFAYSNYSFTYFEYVHVERGSYITSVWFYSMFCARYYLCI